MFRRFSLFLSSDSSSGRAPLPRHETAVRWIILGAFLLLGLNLIRNGTYFGQDFVNHIQSVQQWCHHKAGWFVLDSTNRPLLAWVACAMLHFLKGWDAVMATSFVFLLANTAALWFLHDASRDLMRSPAMRVCCLAMAAFMPFVPVSSVVFAADSCAQLPFTLSLWAICGVVREGASPRKWIYLALAAVALLLGMFAKFTLLLVPLSLCVSLTLLRWDGRLKARLWTVLMLAAVVPSLLLGGWLHVKAINEFKGKIPRHVYQWPGEISVSTLLVPKAQDLAIFGAPGYWDYVMVGDLYDFPLLKANRLSYPALLHLGLYTDVLNFTKQGYSNIGAPRGPLQHTFAEMAVVGGLLFTVSTFLAWLLCVGVLARSLFRGESMNAGLFLPWIMAALAWYVPLVFQLPFLQHAYSWGYWLPRLIMPFVWVSLVLCYRLFEVATEGYPIARRALVYLTMLQVLCQIMSIWYWNTEMVRFVPLDI